MEYQENQNPFVSIYVPVALVALALSMLFFSQINGAAAATESMKWQSANADKQTVALKEGKEKLAKAIEERKPLVATSESLQKTFTDMMKEVNDLAVKGDEDAKKLIVGYGIKISDNPAAAEKK